MIRFEIEKKLREAKRKETQRKKVTQTSTQSVSERSKDRRKVVEDKKDNKKVSALQDLKARREEKKKQGITYVVTADFIKVYAVFLASHTDAHSKYCKPLMEKLHP